MKFRPDGPKYTPVAKKPRIGDKPTSLARGTTVAVASKSASASRRGPAIARALRLSPNPTSEAVFSIKVLAPSTVAAAAVPLKHQSAERAANAAAAARRPRRPFRSPVAAAARGAVVRRRQGTRRRRRPDAAAAARPWQRLWLGGRDFFSDFFRKFRKTAKISENHNKNDKIRRFSRSWEFWTSPADFTQKTAPDQLIFNFVRPENCFFSSMYRGSRYETP